MHRLVMPFVGALALSLSFVAVADAQENVRLRGTIDSVEGDTLTMTTREGEQLTINLAEDTSVAGMVGLELSDLQQGDYIGVAALPGEEERLSALEVHRFPPTANVPQGHNAFDLEPGSTMTNAIVAEVESVQGGQVLRLNYEGGSQEILVNPDTPVVTWEEGDRSLLVPEAAVWVLARRQDDGSYNAMAIRAEKDGVKPPM